MKLKRGELYDVHVYSDRGHSKMYKDMDKQRVGFIKKDIRGRNRRLRAVNYPQYWDMKLYQRRKNNGKCIH